MKVGDFTICKKDFGAFAQKNEIYTIKGIHFTSVEISSNLNDKKGFNILNTYFSEYFMTAGEFREFRINQILE